MTQEQSTVSPRTRKPATFREKLFGKYKDPSSKPSFMGALGVLLGPRVETGDAGATPICNNVRSRLNSDGFLELSNEQELE